MRTDPELIAARLGIAVALVQRLQARGYLNLEMTDGEIRERLYTAHIRAALAGLQSAPYRLARPRVVGGRAPHTNLVMAGEASRCPQSPLRASACPLCPSPWARERQ